MIKEKDKKKVEWVLRSTLATKVKNIQKNVNYGTYYDNKFKTKFIYFYKDDMSFEDFKKSILESDNYTKSLKYLKQIVTVAYNILKENDLKLSRKEIENSLITYMLRRKWIGFKFEYLIKNILEENGFEVKQSEYLDDKYKIDLKVKIHEDEKIRSWIGIQCKCQSFKCGSDYTNKYYKRNIKAIESQWVDDVYYVFHNENAELMLLQNNFKDSCLVDKEWVKDSKTKVMKRVDMKELIKEIDKIKLAYTIRNCNF